jgi:hypothetical protein
MVSREGNFLKIDIFFTGVVGGTNIKYVDFNRMGAKDAEPYPPRRRQAALYVYAVALRGVYGEFG